MTKPNLPPSPPLAAAPVVYKLSNHLKICEAALALVVVSYITAVTFLIYWY